MPRPSSRERKLRFMRSFGDRAFEAAIMKAVHRIGLDHFLTDEQLDEIVSAQVESARASTHLYVRNRAINQAWLDRFAQQSAGPAR